jgi:hypothetical protein
MLIIVADEWKASVSPGLGEPLIALWQREELMIVSDGPLQAHTGERAFHGTNNGHRTAVVTNERGRVDDDTQVIPVSSARTAHSSLGRPLSGGVGCVGSRPIE